MIHILWLQIPWDITLESRYPRELKVNRESLKAGMYTLAHINWFFSDPTSTWCSSKQRVAKKEASEGLQLWIDIATAFVKHNNPIHIYRNVMLFWVTDWVGCHFRIWRHRQMTLDTWHRDENQSTMTMTIVMWWQSRTFPMFQRQVILQFLSLFLTWGHLTLPW